MKIQLSAHLILEPIYLNSHNEFRNLTCQLPKSEANVTRSESAIFQSNLAGSTEPQASI